SLPDAPGWPEAVPACTYVWHLASPVPATLPKDETELTRPAVDGTLRVLRAATSSDTVRRVIMTSSTDAIVHGHYPTGRVRSEADWSNPERLAPYPKSKLYAERPAWDFAARHPLELVTINPGLVLGPLQRNQQNTSMEA